LQRIAADAGIASSAVNVAMMEVAVGENSTAGSSHAPSSSFAALQIGVGAALGVAAVTIDPGAPDVAVLGPSALYTVYRALRHRWQGGILGFLQEWSLYFGSFAITAVTIDGFRAAAPSTSWALICAAVGSGIVTLRSATGRAPTPRP
jgi:hypothetical protein